MHWFTGSFPRAWWLLAGVLWLSHGGTLPAQTTLYWNQNGGGNWTPGNKVWSLDIGGNNQTNWVDSAIAVFSADPVSASNFTISLTNSGQDIAGFSMTKGTSILLTGGTIRLNAPGTFDITAGNTLSISNLITGTTLTKAGTGTLVLSGANTYSGTTSINAGVIVAQNDNALGNPGYYTTTTVDNGAALHLDGGISLSEQALTVSGSGINQTGALRSLAGSNTIAGQLGLTNATLGADAGSTLNLTGPINGGSGTLTATGAGDITVTGAINANIGLVRNHTGTLTLGGTTSNSFSGALSIQSGTVVLAKTGGALATNGGSITVGDGLGAAGSATLRLDNSNQIASYTSAVTISTDGRFDLNSQNQTLTSVTSTGLIALGTGTLTVGQGYGSASIGGAITGTGTLEKIGGNSLTFTSNLGFAGTLQLGGGTVFLNNYTLDVGTLTLTGDSIIDFGTGASALNLTTLNLNGFKLTLQNWTAGVDYFTAQNWTGATRNTTGVSPMNQVTFVGWSANDTRWSSIGNQITPITPVPEPASSGALLALGLLGPVAWYYWRRRNS